MASQVIRLLDNKDKAQFFSKKDQFVHHHIFVSGIDGVLEGKSPWCKICQTGGKHPEGDGQYVSGPLKWLTENPGRQLLTGSFHPISDANWDKEAYVSEGQKGLHPICSAAFSGNDRQLATLLLSDQVNINSFDANGKSPLHHAALHGHVQCVQILLQHGANPNLEEPSRLNTPLHVKKKKHDLYFQKPIFFSYILKFFSLLN